MATEVFVNNSGQSAKTIVLSSTANHSVIVKDPSTTGKVEVYAKGPKGDKGDGNFGGGSLANTLAVTNPIGETPDSYAVATALETIIKDILAPRERPDIKVSSAVFGSTASGSFVPYENHDNKFEVGESLNLFSVTLTSSEMHSVQPDSLISIRYPDQDNEPNTLLAHPYISMPSGGWSSYPATNTVQVSPVGFTGTVIPLNFDTVGRRVITTEFTWLSSNDTIDDTESGENEFEFFIGKRIRCLTSEAADPRGSNLSGNLNPLANVYVNSALLPVINAGPNEEQFSEVLVDFETERQEVIVSFNGTTQSVSDENRYLIIEIPDEFVIEQAAATTAGSGIYSLNDSLVSLENPTGEPYTRNNIAVKYYRSSIPGAFDEKIKIDLQLKLDN